MRPIAPAPVPAQTHRLGAVLSALSLATVVMVALTGCGSSAAGSASSAPLPAPSAATTPSSIPPSPSPVPAEASPTSAAVPSASVPTVPVTDAGVGTVAVEAPIAPVRITIPALAIDMPVTAEGVDEDGAMALPDEAAVAGWYRFGPGLSAAQGATVLAAHIDSWHDGVGPFSRLTDAPVGGVVLVTGEDGSEVSYTVDEVRSVGKIAAPMAELFERTGAPRLVLVTCGGSFDSASGHYVDNVIVTATPTDG